MTVTGTSGYRMAVRRLEELAENLGKRGFITTLETCVGQPSVSVTNRQTSHLSEIIYASPADDGSWWLWWSWAERIAPVEHTDSAAFKIAHVLTAQ
jgi:hypothetical protein